MAGLILFVFIFVAMLLKGFNEESIKIASIICCILFVLILFGSCSAT